MMYENLKLEKKLFYNTIRIRSVLDRTQLFQLDLYTFI